MNPLLLAAVALTLILLLTWLLIRIGIVSKQLKGEFAHAQATIQRQKNELSEVNHSLEASKVQIASLNAEVQGLGIYRGIQDTKKEAERLMAEAAKQIDASNEAARYEAQRIRQQADLQLQTAAQRVQSAQGEAERILSQAKDAGEETQARARQDAQALLNDANAQKTKMLEIAGQKQAEAESFLTRATREEAAIIAKANKKAEEIAGDAIKALREKEQLTAEASAMRNVIEGYGDRYIVPTRSLLDNLAADYEHTPTGQDLKDARKQTRRMVEENTAAQSDLAEPSRRETAIRFVIDAFNGKVDTILSRVKEDNFGTLSQEIRDAYALVNRDALAFRSRIVSSYCEARLKELKLAVVLMELREAEKEEQRRIKEQIREEEKARRDYEKAIKEAEAEEVQLKKAMEKARAEIAKASETQRAKYEAQLEDLTRRLAEAEAKNQRALSMAQQTKAGHVYIISNVGSFGEEVLKVGLTRRLEPMDRVKELSDASVPFTFDVHAMIYSDDAPALERELHTLLDDHRINRVNYRKEFFNVSLGQVRSIVAKKGFNAQFTLTAEAKEFRESKAIALMSPEQRRMYRLGQIPVTIAAEED